MTLVDFVVEHELLLTKVINLKVPLDATEEKVKSFRLSLVYVQHGGQSTASVKLIVL